MSVLKWITVLLCLLQGGYMLFDGCKALITGTYVTPATGDHAGQLGPWAQLVSRFGVPPFSITMKIVFVAFWLTLAIGVFLQASCAWATGLILAVATVWYLVPGTAISIAVLVLLATTAGARWRVSKQVKVSGAGVSARSLHQEEGSCWTQHSS